MHDSPVGHPGVVLPGKGHLSSDGAGGGDVLLHDALGAIHQLNMVHGCAAQVAVLGRGVVKGDSDLCRGGDRAIKRCESAWTAVGWKPACSPWNA